MRRVSIQLTGFLMTLLALSLAGCDRGADKAANTDAGTKTGTTSSTTPTAKSDKELNLFAWSEYVPKEVIDGFTKETGIKVNYEAYDSNEKMLAKLSAAEGTYDLVQPSEYTVEGLIKDGMVEAIDWAKVPNIKNILPAYTKMSYDPEQKFSVPYMAGTVGIVVNTAVVKDDIKGYGDVFQDKFKQRIIALDDARELVTWALYTKNLDINKITPDVLGQVKPVIAKWIPLIKAYNSDSPEKALASGDVDLGIVFSGNAAKLMQDDKEKKFKYILAAEGSHQFVDNLCIPKGAPHKEAALAFMNYILRPEVSVLISKEFPYTNPNAEAVKMLTKEELENPASYPPGDLKLHTFHDIGKAAGDIDTLVTDLKAAK